MIHKINGKIKTLKAIMGMVIIIAGVVMSIAKSYFVLPVEVAHHAKDFTELKDDNAEDHNEFKADIDSCNEWMGETGKELVGIKKDIGYLRKELDDNLLEQKEFQIE